jgi:hypothetical protein
MTAVAAPGLAAFQRDFAAALLADPTSSAAGGVAGQPGFAVYRNTVRRGCIDALAANYPTVAELVGEEWFENAAALFVRAHLPHEGALIRYGEAFADFLETFAPAAELPYLPGVARLDRAWTEAQLAADAPVLVAASLSALSPETLLGAVLVPHPSARWLDFAAVPAFTIWRRHREGLPLADELPWRGESALLLRPTRDVAWLAIDSSAVTFLSACAEGRPFGQAADERAAAWLAPLVAAGVFTRLETTAS